MKVRLQPSNEIIIGLGLTPHYFHRTSNKNGGDIISVINYEIIKLIIIASIFFACAFVDSSHLIVCCWWWGVGDVSEEERRMTWHNREKSPITAEQIVKGGINLPGKKNGLNSGETRIKDESAARERSPSFLGRGREVAREMGGRCGDGREVWRRWPVIEVVQGRWSSQMKVLRTEGRI